MKVYPLSFLIFLLLLSFAFSAKAGDTIPSVKIPVDNVKLAYYPLKSTSYEKALLQMAGGPFEGIPESKKGSQLVAYEGHGLLGALHYAYAEHRPLVLTPDMIWLLITQGVSVHLKENAERFRSKRVNHSGKKLLKVSLPDFRKGQSNNWPALFDALCDSTAQYEKDDLRSAMIADFSTTDTLSIIAQQITYLEAGGSYFNYSMESGCGIPYIRLKGRPEDWVKIREKIQKFRAYDLSFWIDELEPVLKEFEAASKGDSDKVFWREIYKYSDVYTQKYYSGWILKFFPYLKAGTEVLSSWSNDSEGIIYSEYRQKYKKNPFLKGRDYILSDLEQEDLPSGESKIDFVWNDLLTGTSREMRALSGFKGFTQSSETLELCPEITWLVFDKRAYKPAYKNTHSETSRFCIHNFSKGTFRGYSKAEPPIFNPNRNRNYWEGMTDFRKQMRKAVSRMNKSGSLKGKVLVRFTVLWSGRIHAPEVIGKHSPAEHNAALNLIQNIGHWRPAQSRCMWNCKSSSLRTVNFDITVLIDFDRDIDGYSFLKENSQ